MKKIYPLIITAAALALPIFAHADIVFPVIPPAGAWNSYTQTYDPLLTSSSSGTGNVITQFIRNISNPSLATVGVGIDIFSDASETILVASGTFPLAGPGDTAESSTLSGTLTFPGFYYAHLYRYDTNPVGATLYSLDLTGTFLDYCDDGGAVSLTRPAPSSTIYNDFPNWVINTPNLLEGCSYTINISYRPKIGSLTQSRDQAGPITILPDFNITNLLLAKSKNLWNYYNATTTEIDYEVENINNDDGFIVGTDIGKFYLAYSTSSVLTTPQGFNSTLQCGGVCQGFGTVGGGDIPSSVSTASSTIAASGNACVPAADWTDIGGGISYAFCSTLNYLFVPNASTNGIIGGDMAVLETVPPFSWFFAENAAIAGTSAGPGGSVTYTIGGDVSSTSHTPNNGVSFEIYKGIGLATTSMTILPANLTSNSFMANGRLVDDYYNIVLTFMLCLAIIMVYKIVL